MKCFSQIHVGQLLVPLEIIMSKISLKLICHGSVRLIHLPNTTHSLTGVLIKISKICKFLHKKQLHFFTLTH